MRDMRDVGQMVSGLPKFSITKSHIAIFHGRWATERPDGKLQGTATLT